MVSSADSECPSEQQMVDRDASQAALLSSPIRASAYLILGGDKQIAPAQGGTKAIQAAEHISLPIHRALIIKYVAAPPSGDNCKVSIVRFTAPILLG
jgi:hypothetical protein